MRRERATSALESITGFLLGFWIGFGITMVIIGAVVTAMK